MPLLFWSGGLDSTTLAFDIAKHPWRYGIEIGKGSPSLVLVTYGVDKKKRTGMRKLWDTLPNVKEPGWLGLEWTEIAVPFPKEEVVRRTWSTAHPLATGVDAEHMPFTPGLHLFLASYAVNRLRQEADQLRGHEKAQAFFGFQYNAPEWDRFDSGELPDNDTSPDFIAALNAVVEASGESVVFKAPFLDKRMTKPMIGQMAAEIGVPVSATSSCIYGWNEDCGTCPQCMLKGSAMVAFAKVVESQ